jgi:hypothetical protein
MPLATVKVCQRGDARPQYVFFTSLEVEMTRHLQQLLIELRTTGRLDRRCTDITFDAEAILCFPVGCDVSGALRVIERACHKRLGLYWERVDPEDKDYEDMRRAALQMKPHLERFGLNPDGYL